MCVYIYIHIVWMNYNALKVTSLERWLVREVIHNHYSRYGTSHMYFDDKPDVLLIQHGYFSARYVKWRLEGKSLQLRWYINKHVISYDLNCRISSVSVGDVHIQLDHSCWPVLHRLLLVTFLRIVDRVDIPTGVPFTSYQHVTTAHFCCFKCPSAQHVAVKVSVSSIKNSHIYWRHTHIIYIYRYDI